MCQGVLNTAVLKTVATLQETCFSGKKESDTPLGPGIKQSVIRYYEAGV